MEKLEKVVVIRVEVALEVVLEVDGSVVLSHLHRIQDLLLPIVTRVHHHLQVTLDHHRRQVMGGILEDQVIQRRNQVQAMGGISAVVQAIQHQNLAPAMDGILEDPVAQHQNRVQAMAGILEAVPVTQHQNHLPQIQAGPIRSHLLLLVHLHRIQVFKINQFQAITHHLLILPALIILLLINHRIAHLTVLHIIVVLHTPIHHITADLHIPVHHIITDPHTQVHHITAGIHLIQIPATLHLDKIHTTLILQILDTCQIIMEIHSAIKDYLEILTSRIIIMEIKDQAGLVF